MDLNQRVKLSPSMTLSQFDNGYWYATQLKDFAEETKAFLEREAQKLVPGLKRKSGVRYRFNRWREEQFVTSVGLTYGDLVKEYVRLNQIRKPFAKIPIDCYINLLSDFLAAEKGATREQAIKAWKKLKVMNVPKNYSSWAQARLSGLKK
jgi:hypothetical protein